MSVDEFNEVKMEIRSVLLPFQKGCSLSDFRKEFRNLIGTSIPYAKFECKNEIEFLYEMPDVVRILPSRQGDYHLVGLPDDSTRHISKMVQNQKPSKTRIGTSRQPYSTRQPPRYSYSWQASAQQRPAESMQQRSAMSTQQRSAVSTQQRSAVSTQQRSAVSTQQRPAASTHQRPAANIQPVPVTSTQQVSAASVQQRPTARVTKGFELPPRFQSTSGSKKELSVEMKQNIVHVVTQFSRGMNLSHFLPIYERAFKTQFSFRNYGYFTLEECLLTVEGLYLKTIDNDIMIYASPSMKRKQEQEVLSNMHEPPLQSITNNGGDTDTKSKNTGGQEKIKQEVGPLSSKFCEYGSQQNIKKEVNQHSFPAFVESGSQPHKYFQDEVSDYSIHSFSSDKNMNQGSPSQHSGANNLDNAPNITENIKAKLRKVVDRNPNGIWAAHFPACYEEVNNLEFDLHSLGFTDLISFVDAVPNVLQRKEISGSINKWLIFGTDALQQKGINTSDVKSGPFLIEFIILNTQKILQAYSEGIKLSEFVHLYSLNCNDPLYLADLGFDNIENFLLTIADRVPLKLGFHGDCKMVYPANFPSLNPMIAGQKESIPYDAAAPDSTYTTLNIRDKFDTPEFIPVYTSSILSPQLLYIQIQGEDTSEALQLLSDKMEEFYDGKYSESYKMKTCHIKPNAVCIALWPQDKYWYRARILETPSPDCVKVTYVDYGTCETIPISMLRYIKEEYLHFPIQAIASRLAYLKPPHNATRWDNRVKNRMLSLCLDISLMAKIENIGSDGLLELLLCDTNEEGKDKYITDILIAEEYAEPQYIPSPTIQTCELASSMQALNFINPFAQPAVIPAQSIHTSFGYTAQSAFPNYGNAAYANTSQSPEEYSDDEIFVDDSDERFEIFCKQISQIQKRHVKRMRTQDGYMFHIILVDSTPHVTSGDVSKLIWKHKESDFLQQILQNSEQSPPAVPLLCEGNEEIFGQMKRCKVNGINADLDLPVLLYQLKDVISILNDVGQPSAILRQMILREVSTFDPRDFVWKEFKDVSDNEEECSGATDDDKLNLLCIFDLKTILTSIGTRRDTIVKRMMEVGNGDNSVDEVKKLEESREKVEQRLSEVRQICSTYSSC